MIVYIGQNLLNVIVPAAFAIVLAGKPAQMLQQKRLHFKYTGTGINSSYDRRGFGADIRDVSGKKLIKHFGGNRSGCIDVVYLCEQLVQFPCLSIGGQLGEGLHQIASCLQKLVNRCGGIVQLTKASIGKILIYTVANTKFRYKRTKHQICGRVVFGCTGNGATIYLKL